MKQYSAAFLLLPFVLQGLSMMVDEFYFHLKRGLPKWERIGHPIDTLSVLLSYLFILNTQYALTNLYIYIGLAAFSCLLVTKDEFVHAELCDAKENWLHALLFVLHPLCFLSAGFIWYFYWLGYANGFLFQMLKIQASLIFLFMLYQIIYWSFIWKAK